MSEATYSKFEVRLGSYKVEEPTYKLTTKLIPGRHWWERHQREHSLECVQTGVVLSGMDDQGLAIAYEHLKII